MKSFIALTGNSLSIKFVTPSIPGDFLFIKILINFLISEGVVKSDDVLATLPSEPVDCWTRRSVGWVRLRFIFDVSKSVYTNRSASALCGGTFAGEFLINLAHFQNDREPMQKELVLELKFSFLWRWIWKSIYIWKNLELKNAKGSLICWYTLLFIFLCAIKALIDGVRLRYPVEWFCLACSLPFMPECPGTQTNLTWFLRSS